MNNQEAGCIKFGGLAWVVDENGRLSAHIKGQGECYVSQYTEESPSKGRWYWRFDFDEALDSVRLVVLDKRISGIEDTRDHAMSACINALDDYLEDLRSVLTKLRPGDDYAKGFAHGKVALAVKLQTELDQAMAA